MHMGGGGGVDGWGGGGGGVWDETYNWKEYTNRKRKLDYHLKKQHKALSGELFRGDLM